MQSQEELEELADSIPPTSTRTALEELLSDHSSTSVVVARRLMDRWSRQSPEAAAQWAALLPDNAFSHAMYRAMVIPWAQTNLNAALTWVRQQPDSGNKAEAELSLANTIASEKEPVKAIDLLADLPASPERDRLLDYSARQWAGQDREAAIAWINQIPDAAARAQLLRNMTIDCAVESPVDAAALVATTLPSGEEQKESVAGVVRFWAAAAPDQAAQWVEAFSPGEAKDIATANLMAVWEKISPLDADAWFKQLTTAP